MITCPKGAANQIMRTYALQTGGGEVQDTGVTISIWNLDPFPWLLLAFIFFSIWPYSQME